MPTLLARWHLAAQQAHDNHPTLARYLLIDAAQLSINALPWKDLLACRQIDNLLKDRPEASAPEICGLLMPYEHHWVASLLERSLARRPFAFTLLVSALPREQLARGLSRKTNVALSKHRTGLLRFYDSTSLQALLKVLEPRRINALLGHAQVWVYVRRDGVIDTANPSIPLFGRSATWGLSDQELLALERLEWADRLTVELQNSGHVPVNVDPFFIYEHITQLIALLNDGGELELTTLYRCCALLIGLPLSDIERGEISALVMRCRNSGEDLLSSLRAWRTGKHFSRVFDRREK